MSEYIPNPMDWVADQVELYERSGGTEGLTLRDTGLPCIIVTNRGWKTGAIRKTPLMRVLDREASFVVGTRPPFPVQFSHHATEPVLFAFSDESRYPLCNHHCRHIGVGPNAVRHYRRINDPQVFHPVHFAMLVHDSHVA